MKLSKKRLYLNNLLGQSPDYIRANIALLDYLTPTQKALNMIALRIKTKAN